MCETFKNPYFEKQLRTTAARILCKNSFANKIDILH